MDQAVAWSLPLHTQGAWKCPLFARNRPTSFPAGYEFLMQNCTRSDPCFGTKPDQNPLYRSIWRQNLHFRFLAGRVHCSRSRRNAHQSTPSLASRCHSSPAYTLIYRSGSSPQTTRSRSHSLIKCTRVMMNSGGNKAVPSGTRFLSLFRSTF